MVQNSGEKTIWDVENLVNHEINYQPQLVSRIHSISSISPINGLDVFRRVEIKPCDLLRGRFYLAWNFLPRLIITPEIMDLSYLNYNLLRWCHSNLTVVWCRFSCRQWFCRFGTGPSKISCFWILDWESFAFHPSGAPGIVDEVNPY